jgi:hypothetical protein
MVVEHGPNVVVVVIRLCLNEMSTHSFWRRLLFRKTHVYRVLISFKHSCISMIVFAAGPGLDLPGVRVCGGGNRC